MRSRLPLGAWLAIALALAITVPALCAAATWWVVGSRQDAQVASRAGAAARAISDQAQAIGDPGLPIALAERLAALHVEAEIEPIKPALPVDATPLEIKQAALANAAVLTTKGLAATIATPDGKRTLQQRFVTRAFSAGPARGTLFVERPSRSTRVAATVAAALVALTLVLLLCSILLRRWVVQPLGRLAAAAEGIAGGALDVPPVASPAREVHDVGAALSGTASSLERALAERDAADEQRRFLVTAMAHDLRTPLFTLRGSLEAIEHGIGDGDHLRRAQDKAAVLDRLVSDLFTFSRVEYAGADVRKERLDAAALAREAAQAVDARILVTAPAGPTYVEANHAALLRVLLNLLDNAVRHAHRTVELTVGGDTAGVTFVVTDDGAGIADTDLPHLFEPLFRGDRARGDTSGGAGLGLAIVDRLSTAQGATVTAANDPRGGARFTVHVPNRR
jgi:signal transduction histidine kinase